MIKMIALSTFKGVEGFIITGREFEATERRADFLERRGLAKRFGPANNKINNPLENKGGEVALLADDKYTVADLEEVAKLLELSGYSGLKKEEFINMVSKELGVLGIEDLGEIDKDSLIEIINERK